MVFKKKFLILKGTPIMKIYIFKIYIFFLFKKLKNANIVVENSLFF